MKPFSGLQKVPVVWTVVYIINSHVYGGDPRASSELAPIRCWFSTLSFPVLLAFGLTAIVVWPALQCWPIWATPLVKNLPDVSQHPGALILSIVPSLLGFGIGVYALVFALGAKTISEIHKRIEESKGAGKMKEGSVLMLNSDLAYPLIILLIAVSVGVIQSASSSAWLVVFCWAVFWYSMIVTLQLIGVLFGLGDLALLEKVSSGDESKQ